MSRRAMGVLLLLAGAGSSLAAQETSGQRTFMLPHVLEVMGKAVDQPMPAGLSRAAQQAWAEQTAWLKTVLDRVEALGVQAGVVAPRDAQTGQSSGQRQHQPIKIRTELDKLQKEIELEGRKFSALSGALKARHDVAMNAIRNMKA